jgi:hypothetical protein
MISWLLGIAQYIPIIGKLIDSATAYFSKKLDTDLEKYKVDGKIDEVRIQAALILLGKMQDSRGGRFMHYVFVYPLAFWWVALIVDSVGQRYFKWDYDVLALPEPAQTWAGWMIAFLFLVAVARGK